ncbi:unnamed protein product, partial [Allacma fusca]
MPKILKALPKNSLPNWVQCSRYKNHNLMT